MAAELVATGRPAPPLPPPGLHTAFSDPGPHAALLRAVEPSIPEVSAVARNLITHYRGEEAQLPASSRDDINLRWLADQLATDQDRHGGRPLAAPRELADRLQGCCRDHSLFCVGTLREHGVPARTRIGFAAYFTPGFHHDHVVVEVLDGGRWRRFDPELGPDFTSDFDVTDMETGLASPFETSAEVWLAHRAGGLDVSQYGVDPSLPLRGEAFVRRYVVHELAHRLGDELLLWDVWGLDETSDATDDLLDRVATLLVAADAEEHGGDLTGDATAELAELYAADARLRPGGTVFIRSPLDPTAAPRRVSLLSDRS